jgi:hypothetical protein
MVTDVSNRAAEINQQSVRAWDLLRSSPDHGRIAGLAYVVCGATFESVLLLAV